MINALSIMFPINVMNLEYRIKADGTMYIVGIDKDNTCKGKSSACKGKSSVCKGKSISSVYKGKSKVDMHFPLVDCHRFFVYESICASSEVFFTIAFLCDFVGSFFAYASLTSSAN